MYRRTIVNLMFRRCADRSGSFAVVLLATVGCSFVALTGCGRASEPRGASTREPSTSADPPATAPASASPTYTLMQMNVCLSGFSGCNGKTAYPAVVDEAVARIRQA